MIVAISNRVPTDTETICGMVIVLAIIALGGWCAWLFYRSLP